jgi:hypothetical protein
MGQKFIRYWLEGLLTAQQERVVDGTNGNLKLRGGVWMSFSLGRLSTA